MVGSLLTSETVENEEEEGGLTEAPISNVMEWRLDTGLGTKESFHLTDKSPEKFWHDKWSDHKPMSSLNA